jgi:hypothetical protein
MRVKPRARLRQPKSNKLVGNPTRCCGISKYNDFMSIVQMVSNQGKIINLKTKTLLQQKQKFISL